MEYVASPLTIDEEISLTMDKHFAVIPAISRSLRDPSFGIFITQLYYWQKQKDPRFKKTDTAIDGGWTWKTKEEWFEETGLTESSLDSIRKKLKKLGILEERTERLIHRTYYRLVPAKIHELIRQDVERKRAMREGKPSLANPMTSGSPTPQQEVRQPRNIGFANPMTSGSSIYESTPKNTSDIIPAMPECSSSESPGSSVPPIPAPPLEHPSTPSVVDLPPTTSAAAPPFDSDEYIDDMMDPDKEKNKAVRLIGNYLFYLGDQYPSAKAIGSVIRQNVRLANTIVEEGWTEEEIEGLMEELANDSFWKNKHWSLKNFKDRLPKYRADFAAKKNQKIVRHL